MASQPSEVFSNKDRADYSKAREFFLSDQRFKDAVPEIISNCPSLGGLRSSIINNRDTDARVHSIHIALGPLRYRVFADNESQENEAVFNPAVWTGQLSRAQRLMQVKTMVPVAMGAIDQLIAHLEQSGPNGGPILDHKSEAVQALRKLHSALGNILSSIDDGSLMDNFGEGLPADAARYAIRAAEALIDDPMPYSVSALLLAIFTALGFPAAGAWMSAIAVTFSRTKQD